MNKKALHKLSSGLFLLSTKNGAQTNGCIINTVMQISSEPILLTACISKNNLTHDLLLKSRICAVSVLSENISMDTICRFGFQSGRDTDKFAAFPHNLAQNGAPYIMQNISAYFAGTVVNTVDAGTHTLFIIEVTEMDTLTEETPLTYAYYQSVKKGTSPKNAPTYQAETAQKGYRCSICGYIAEVEELPADFVCPVCKQPREVFVKL